MALFKSFAVIVVLLNVATASITKENGNKYHGSEYHGAHNPNFPANAKAADDVESKEEKDHSRPYYHGVHNPNFSELSVDNLEVKETDYHNGDNDDHNPNFPVSSAEDFDSKEIKDQHQHGPYYHGPNNPNFPLNSEDADKLWPSHNEHGSESHESHGHGHHGFEHKFPFFVLPFLKPHHGDHGHGSGSHESNEHDHSHGHGSGNKFPFFPFNRPNHNENNTGNGFHIPNFPWFPTPNLKPAPEDDKIVNDAGSSSPNSDERPNQLFPNFPYFGQQGPRDQE